MHQYTAKRFCRGGLVGIVVAKSTADPRDETDRELAGGSTASSAIARDGTTDAESHRCDRRRPAPRAIAAGTPRASDRRDLNPVETSGQSVADRRLEDADHTTQDDAKQREVSASAPAASDQAIRVAAKLAIDAGHLERARALLDLLAPSHCSSTLPPLALVTRKVLEKTSGKTKALEPSPTQQAAKGVAWAKPRPT